MLFEFGDTDLRDGRAFEVVPDWITFSGGRVDVVGQTMGIPEIYLYHSLDLVVVGTTAGAVLDRVREIGRSPTLSSFGISQFLHHGLVPPPHTEWDDLWFLGKGDRCVLTTATNGIEARFERMYPYLQADSTGESQPSTSTLLDVLTAATDRQVNDAGGDGVLMMSSGKDSVSVAVALAEGGHTEISCVTYRTGPDDTENDIAAGVCRKLGLTHRTYDIPDDASIVEADLIRFFEASPRPCADLVQIPYALVVGDVGVASGVVLDGGGNDLYMGIVPNRKFKAMQGLRIRNERLAQQVERFIPTDSIINYFTRSRVATQLSGRTFRLPDTRQFYPEVVDTRPFWAQISDETAEIGAIDLGTTVATAFHDQAEVHLKAHVAAQAFEMTAAFPYCDSKVVDYLFDLPASTRYDAKSGVTKILLREMLLDTIGYDAESVGKHYFGFEGDRFLIAHRVFVMSEISGCSLWSSDVASLAASWLDQLERRPLLYHSLLVLFQLSGWYNHSRYAR
ncbi:MAG: asparagine synthase-related protein [Actinomycetia bacterium]|nr:asparagine synthase-related protein [Actinomycetes bacterium]